MYLLFSHRVTPVQERAAHQQLGVQEVLQPPEPLLRLWAAIPPEAESLRPVLEPVFSWIGVTLHPGDYLLVQGDFGACYLVVEFARKRDVIPVYSTTHRHAREERLTDGSIRLVHTFEHVRFREYGR